MGGYCHALSFHLPRTYLPSKAGIADPLLGGGKGGSGRLNELPRVTEPISGRHLDSACPCSQPVLVTTWLRKWIQGSRLGAQATLSLPRSRAISGVDPARQGYLLGTAVSG